jgi:hypothetical protein
MLWWYYLINGIVFLIGLVLIGFFEPQRKLTLLSWLVFDLILSFTFTIEFPGWAKLSRFDETEAKALTNLRTVFIKLRYSFEQSFSELKQINKNQKETLKEEELDSLINDFIEECENMDEALNINLWTLTLNETTARINNINERSKHPIPKLIDILALSGLSVLIAELLKLIG